MGNINALVAIKPQRHFAESILSDFGDETDSRAEPRTAHGLIRTLPAIVHAITGSQERLAGAREALNFHGQAGCVTAHDSNARNAQRQSLRSMRRDG